MKISILNILIIASLIISSCVSDDYFGLSSSGNIKTIEIANQASTAIIDNTTQTITIELPPGINSSALLIKSLTLSSFASSDKNVGDVVNLNDNDSIIVLAEDGSTHTWIIMPQVSSLTPKLINGDFTDWYQTSSGYYEPGLDAATTIWGTGNPGTQILGLLATTPLEVDGDLAVKMETLYNGSLSAALGMPISAGSVFVGKFDSEKIDPTNPQAAIDFGTPFIGRPERMSFDYAYSPGDENKDKNGNLLAYSDHCDIYAYLEIRYSNETLRLATAWFRDDQEVNHMTNITMEFSYGALDDSFPDYMKPENGLYVSNDSIAFVLPTHLTVVASSSYDGANFAGAVGSELLLDNVTLIYE